MRRGCGPTVGTLPDDVLPPATAEQLEGTVPALGAVPATRLSPL